MESSSNTLGLDFDQLKLADDNAQTATATTYNNNDAQPLDTAVVSDTQDSGDKGSKEKKKPYNNPDRVKTGGTQRDKLSEDALSERMARIKEQNEKIKQRRLDVQADEDAFKQTQEADRAKQAQNRKVQANVDKAREQNAQRKMAKVQSREWDTGKPGVEWKMKPAPSTSTTVDAEAATTTTTTTGTVTSKESPASPSSEAARGGRGGRGGQRGRGGSRPKHSPTSEAAPTPAETTTKRSSTTVN